MGDESGESAGIPGRDAAIEGWAKAAGKAATRPAELLVPSNLLTRSPGERSKWSVMATRGSRAPIVYLGLVGLFQLVLAPREEARYDEERPEWRNYKPRGVGSLTELFGYRGTRGLAVMTTAMRQLMNVGLLKTPRSGAKGYGVWRRFDLLDPGGGPYIVPSPRHMKTRGYNDPFVIGLPIGFWRNGWLLELSTKEIEALLSLLYQRERQPTRPDGRGWFVSPEQRELLCLDPKTFGASHFRLVERGLLTPVDAASYAESKATRGLGRRRYQPHEFLINLGILDALPPSGPPVDADWLGDRDPGTPPT